MRKILSKKIQNSILERCFSKQSDFAKRLKREVENPFKIKTAQDDKFSNKKKFQQKPDFDDDISLTADHANTTEYEADYHTNEKEASLHELPNKKQKLDSVLDDFLKSTNKTEIIIKSERLLECIRKGDYKMFLETTQREFEDMHQRFDFYKENFVSQQSNQKMKITEEVKDKERSEAVRDMRSFLKFQEIADSKFGKSADLDYKEMSGLTGKDIEVKKQVQEFIDEDLVPPEIRTEDDDEKDSAFKIPPKFGLKDVDYRKIQKISIEEEIEDFEGQMKMMEHLREEDTDMFYEVGGSEMLSFRAKLGVFKCYLEGWNVREISVRYGILPNRVKAIVWSLQHFLEEYLPNLDTNELISLMMLEALPNPDVRYVDYGLDTEIMSLEQEGEVSKVFSRNKLSIVPGKNQEIKFTREEIDNKIKKEVKKKEDFLIEEFKIVGKGTEPYAMKNWIIHKGKGSLRVNAMFKRIVESSHVPDTLPANVRAKMHLGPRIASLGCTHR